MLDVDEESRQLAEVRSSLSLGREVPSLRAELLVDFHAGTEDYAPADYDLYLNEGADDCLYSVTKHRARFECTSAVALKARERVIGFTVLKIGEQLKDINFQIAV